MKRSVLTSVSRCALWLPMTLTACGASKVETPAVQRANMAHTVGEFCSLPDAFVASKYLVDNHSVGLPAANLSWLTMPEGFCAHYYATVPVVRQLRFAPGGDLFAASPGTATYGGGRGGLAAIVILPDDNHDGLAEQPIPFITRSAAGSDLWSTQGFAFTEKELYYQDGTVVRRIPFAAKDRSPSAPPQSVVDMATVAGQSGLHWPKAIEASPTGGVYIANASDDENICKSTPVIQGAIFKLNSDGSIGTVASGMRNPIAIRCSPAHDVCLGIDLGMDHSTKIGGREKIVPIRPGDDWGYPCCASHNLPYTNSHYADTGVVPDCSSVAADVTALRIGDTPFSLDFAPESWPAPWGGRLLVVLHGSAGQWLGARIIALALDKATSLPLPANDLDFATGWDDGRRAHGRPAALAFAPDGRLFVGDDQNGVVFWIAPVGLKQPM